MSDDYLEDLNMLAKDYKCVDYTYQILNNPKFKNWSGSCHKPAHHYGQGGLLKHTWEVVNLCLQTAFMFKNDHEIDERALFLSALYHDYGKIWDYSYDLETGTWVGNNHRRTIHHIQRSAIEWQIVARTIGMDEELANRITHNILSHHGRRDYGSPVAPYTREAWILHLCDSLSARIDDVDRLDMLKINKQ